VKGAAVVRLVAGRELRERSRKKSFKLSTGFIALALLAAVLVPQVLGDDGPTSYDIGVVGAVPEVVTATIDELGASTGAELKVVPVTDVSAGEAQIRDGSLDLLITGGDVAVDEVVVDEEPEPASALGVVSVGLAQALALNQGLEDAGLAPDEAADALARPPAPVRILAAADDQGPDDGPQPLLFLGVIVLYISLLTFGVAVTTGVVEEKTTRVVEVLLSAIRPHQLLAGKVLGIGALGVIQLVLVATPALAVALATGTELPSGSALTVASLLLWFVLGYALYSCAYAAAGSLVSRMEEAQNTSFPVTFALIAAYGGAIYVGNVPDSGAARFLGLFPPTAPLVMPARAALADIPWWEVPLAVALTLAATYALVGLAGRIYAGSVLRFGPKVKLRQALASSSAPSDERAAA
jgi:ABC-2 type transport system permease protein